MQYYIIDDLRLPPKRTFHKGWTMERFPSLQEALAMCSEYGFRTKNYDNCIGTADFNISVFG